MEFAAGVGLLQQREPVPEHGIIGHLGHIVSPIAGVDLLPGQQPLLCQGIQIDKVRVPCKCGKRLVGAVPIAGGSHRKYLPVFLPCFLQKIHKLVSGLSKRTDPIRRWETGNRHQNACAAVQHSLHTHPVLSIQITVLLYITRLDLKSGAAAKGGSEPSLLQQPRSL